MTKVTGKWEHLPCGDDYAESYRIKVPGGWIIRSRGYHGGIEHIFIKDSKHTWVIDGTETTSS